MAHVVENLPAMQEIQVRSLGGVFLLFLFTPWVPLVLQVAWEPLRLDTRLRGGRVEHGQGYR